MKPITHGALAIAMAAALSAAAVPTAFAQAPAPRLSDDKIRIGVLTDMSGIFADLSGPGSLLAARMAVEDAGGTLNGKPIEVIFADTLNKADVAASRAREWYDQGGVDYVVDMPSSSVALAVAKLAADKGKLATVVGGASTLLTNEECSPTTFHWAYDTYSLATSTARAIVKQGGDSWYFITADYAGGHALAKDAVNVVTASGGKVLGEVRHAFGANDYSSFLLSADASGSKVIAIANAGNDTITTIKQAAEFGITQKKIMAATLLFDTDVHSIGLKDAQGMYLTTGFYWDYDAQTRAFGKRFHDKHKRMPTMVQAGVYSAVAHYLKAVKAIGSDEPKAVAAEMKKLPVNDVFARNGVLRADGRMVHDMYLAQVKKPEDSKYPWDYFTIKEVVKGEDAYLPLSRSTCKLVQS